MLSIANSTVDVDYSKISKNLEKLISQYDKVVDSIKKQSKALDDVKGTISNLADNSSIKKINSELSMTKDVANNLKGELLGLFAPLEVEAFTSEGKLEIFTHSVGNLLSSFVSVSDAGKDLGRDLSSLGSILNEMTSAFIKVALASVLINSDGVEGITSVFNGLSSVINSINPLLETVSNNGLELMDVAKFLGVVLVGLCTAFIIAAGVVKLFNSSGLSEVGDLFTGLGTAITAIVPLLELFKDNSISLETTTMVLVISLGLLLVALLAISKISKGNVSSSILLLSAALIGLGVALSGVASIFESFGNSGLGVVGALIALLGVLAIIIVFLTFLTALAQVLSKDMAALGALILLVAAIAVVMNVLADTLPIILTAISDFINALAPVIVELLTIIGSIIVNIIEVIGTILPPIIDTLGNLILNILGTVGELISNLIEILGTVLPPIVESIGTLFSSVFEGIASIIEKVGNLILNLIEILGTVLPPIIESVGGLFSSIFNGIANVIKSVGSVLVNILNTLKNLVTTVLDSILNFINKLGPAINNFVDNAIIAITKLINFMISGIEYLINTLFIGAINGLISKISGLTEVIGIEIPKIKKVELERFIPRLAKGAVIPPRHEFLAVLGDQRYGTNIEAPLETIKEANREVLREFKGLSQGEVVLKNLSIVAQFGNKEFKKMVMDSIRLSEKEMGKTLLVS